MKKLVQKQHFRLVLKKRCAKNMQQSYTRTPMPKGDFNKVAKQTCKVVNLLHIFRTSFPKNTSGGLFLFVANGLLPRLVNKAIKC